MQDTRTINIVIPTWQRFSMTVDSFAQVVDDSRVAGIYITDDFSLDGSYETLKNYFRDNKKVHIFRNEKNLNCYFAKHSAMSNAPEGFCVLLDSDNSIDTDYIDALFAIPEWDINTVYQPQFSRPHFDFRKFAGVTLTKENVNDYMHTNLETAMNAMNFFIDRNEYLKVFDSSIEAGSSDSIYFNYCWLKNNNKFHITKDLEYNHYISPNNDGHYQTHYHLYKKFHKEVIQKIKELK